jgi:bromodomain and PHD finger-containing protein 1
MDTCTRGEQQQVRRTRRSTATAQHHDTRQRRTGEFFKFTRTKDPSTMADDDAVCEICQHGDSVPGNQILFCDGKDCGVIVHQECYGVLEVPEGDWRCATCALGIPANTAVCVLCPHRGGAMKTVVDSSTMGPQSPPRARRSAEREMTWAHIVCAMWVPETHFGDEEGVDLIMVGCAAPPNVVTSR